MDILMKNRWKYIATTVFSICMLTACNDKLDPEVDLNQSEEQILRNYNNTGALLNNIYAYMPNGLYYIDNAMMASACDEAEHTLETSTIQKYNTGNWNANDNPDGAWGNCFKAINLVNDFLKKKDQVDLDYLKYDQSESVQQHYELYVENMKRWEFEARFLRAFFYFELVKRYGGVPLMTEVQGMTPDYSKLGRKSLDECIKFIDKECEIAAENLPAVYADPGDLGRATKGAALALKSRVLLYAASDLYNNPTWANGFAHPELISLTGDRTEKWDTAARAAKKVIDLTSANYSFATDYTGLFRTYNNNEIILCFRDGANNTFEKNNYPIGYDGGNSGTTPSGNLVDDYEMDDGTPFDWNNPEHAKAPYLGRDPRLGYTILTNNTQFKGRAVECWTGGRDGKGVMHATRTGYYLKKYIDPDVDLLLNQSSVHSWILIRLSEIYLNYAEAMNEAYGPDDPHGYGMTAREALNAVRTRTAVGMPAIMDGGQDELRERIRHERRIELAFEDHRFWDVRRWMIAPETLGKPLKGVEITRAGSSFSYNVIDVENRTFQNRMYFYPIPQKDLNIVGTSWVQNPMW